jgi:hypothetical protein
MLLEPLFDSPPHIRRQWIKLKHLNSFHRHKGPRQNISAPGLGIDDDLVRGIVLLEKRVLTHRVHYAPGVSESDSLEKLAISHFSFLKYSVLFTRWSKKVTHAPSLPGI